MRGTETPLITGPRVRWRMLRVAVWLLLVAPDGGLTEQEVTEVLHAEVRCFDNDGGIPAQRIGNCVVTCVGEDSTTRLVDGGVCFQLKIEVAPSQVGDFWLPGERPVSPRR